MSQDNVEGTCVQGMINAQQGQNKKTAFHHFFFKLNTKPTKQRCSSVDRENVKNKEKRRTHSTGI